MLNCQKLCIQDIQLPHLYSTAGKGHHQASYKAKEKQSQTHSNLYHIKPICEQDSTIQKFGLGKMSFKEVSYAPQS